MKKGNVIELVQPGEFNDQLTEVLRQGAQNLVLQAVEAEFTAFLESHAHEKLADGRQRIVRHGHLPARFLLKFLVPAIDKAIRQRIQFVLFPIYFLLMCGAAKASRWRFRIYI
jgi:putative transposase